MEIDSDKCPKPHSVVMATEEEEGGDQSAILNLYYTVSLSVN